MYTVPAKTTEQLPVHVIASVKPNNVKFKSDEIIGLPTKHFPYDGSTQTWTRNAIFSKLVEHSIVVYDSQGRPQLGPIVAASPAYAELVRKCTPQENTNYKPPKQTGDVLVSPDMIRTIAGKLLDINNQQNVPEIEVNLSYIVHLVCSSVSEKFHPGDVRRKAAEKSALLGVGSGFAGGVNFNKFIGGVSIPAIFTAWTDEYLRCFENKNNRSIFVNILMSLQYPYDYMSPLCVGNTVSKYPDIMRSRKATNNYAVPQYNPAQNAYQPNYPNVSQPTNVQTMNPPAQNAYQPNYPNVSQPTNVQTMNPPAQTGQPAPIQESYPNYQQIGPLTPTKQIPVQPPQIISIQVDTSGPATLEENDLIADELMKLAGECLKTVNRCVGVFTTVDKLARSQEILSTHVKREEIKPSHVIPALVCCARNGMSADKFFECYYTLRVHIEGYVRNVVNELTKNTADPKLVRNIFGNNLKYKEWQPEWKKISDQWFAFDLVMAKIMKYADGRAGNTLDFIGPCKFGIIGDYDLTNVISIRPVQIPPQIKSAKNEASIEQVGYSRPDQLRPASWSEQPTSVPAAVPQIPLQQPTYAPETPLQPVYTAVPQIPLQQTNVPAAAPQIPPENK
jgi:hypothetical protein